MNDIHGRNLGVDLAKSLAIMGVVVIHNCSKGLNSSILSIDWISTVLIRSVVSASVPLFFMCSGTLLLEREKDCSLRQLYTKRLLRIVLAMLMWAMGYKIFHLIVGGTFHLSAILHAVKEVLLFKHEYHLYYLHIILIVYLWLPVVRVFTKNASQSELRYLLVLWFVFGILYPTIKGFWPFTLLSGIPLQWAMNMTYAAIGYTILGYYVSHYPIKHSLLALFSSAGFLIVFIGTVLMSAHKSILYTGLLEGMSVGVALLAIGTFGFCCRTKCFSSFNIILQLSRASFCIYLVHVLVIYVLQGIGVTTSSPYIVTIPLLTLLNILISYFVYIILKRIPLIKNWLI